MARFIKDRTKAKGIAPGSLVFIGKQKMEEPVIQLIEFDATSLIEKEIYEIEDVKNNLLSERVSWINIYGIHNLEVIKKVGEIFKIPALLLEDILDTDQRPKYENNESLDVFILKMLSYNKSLRQIKAEQITLVLGKHFVLTLQEREGDVFAPVRERIRNSKGRLRLNDNDYLIYALLDTIVENYTITVETVGQEIEDLDDKIFRTKDSNLAEEIYKLKTELNFLRKSIRPVNEVMSSLLRSEHTLFQEKNRMFLKDLSELATHSIDAIELYNNLVSDQLNIYNTNVSNRMNEVMKVLTIFASIFIPLTFIAGIYGMNFKYLPELEYRYSYPIFWGLVLSLGIGLLFFFRKRKWF